MWNNKWVNINKRNKDFKDFKSLFISLFFLVLLLRELLFSIFLSSLQKFPCRPVKIQSDVTYRRTLGSRKKVIFVVVGQLRGGWPLKKNLFFKLEKKLPKKGWPLSSRGGGVRALVVGLLKKGTFLRLPLRMGARI